MAVLTNIPQLEDDYSAEVIRLARERSQNIDAWIVEQKYLLETSEENLSPLWLRNRCVIKICEDLTEMGIVIQKDPDDICDSPEWVYTVLMLRKKFDPDELCDLLKSHSELHGDLVAELDGESITTIIDWCGSNLPLDEGWGLLKKMSDENPGMIGSDTREFISMLKGVLRKLDNLGAADITEDIHPELVTKYVGFLGKRLEYIRQTAYSIWVNAGVNEYEKTSRKRIIDNYLDGEFESHLGTRKAMIAIGNDKLDSLNLADRSACSKFIEKIREPYKKHWKHDLAYYIGDETRKCSEGILAIMIARTVVDAPSVISAKNCFESYVGEYAGQLTTEDLEKVEAFGEQLLQNLVNPVEVNYAS